MTSRPQSQVAQLYEKVIQDVINNVRDSFLDDGVDEQVLTELKQIWETKLAQTKAVDSPTIGDRVRPSVSSVYPYAMTNQKTGASVLYQVPSQTVQLSTASQQGRAGVPASIIYQHGVGGNIVLPTKKQMFTSYQPMRQHVPQQVLSSGDTIVLTTASNDPSQGSNKPGPSGVVQVDGCSDDTVSDTTVNRSKVCTSSHTLRKVFPRKKPQRIFLQVDGKGDSSSSDDDLGRDDDDDDEEDDEDEDDDETNEETQEKEENDEEPLNSDDDDSDQDASELFDVENVVVCQYDKIHRAKAKWKFNLKVGIMNLEGKDHVFQKATGEADW